MTTTVLGYGGTGYSQRRGSHAVSDAAKTILDCLQSAISDVRQPIVERDRIEKVNEEIGRAYREAAEHGWDSYGGKPLSHEAAAEAAEFLNLLPRTMPLPEITVEPTGSVSLDWIASRHRIFSITLSGTDKLVYAGIFGQNETHGTESFEYSAPEIILRSLERLYSHNK